MGLRYAIRSLARAPLYTAAAVAILAIGIGSNTAIFSVIDAVLLRPLPFPHSDRLVRCSTIGVKSREVYGTSYPDFLDWSSHSKSFDELAAARGITFNLSGTAGAQSLNGQIVSPDFFEVFGVPTADGRTLADSANEQAVVISHGLFARVFGSDRHWIGKSIALDGDSYLIAGVMPASFDFPNDTELWMSSSSNRPDNREEVGSRGTRRFTVYGRLKPGVSVAQAQSELDAIASHEDREFGVRVQSLQEDLTGDYRKPLLLIMGAVVFVLLIVCANMGNLLLARSISKRKEIEIRLALGASRRRIVNQVLLESILLGIGGGVAGALLAYAAIRALIAVAPADVPMLVAARVDGLALAFTAVLSVLTGAIFGIAPAWQISRLKPASHNRLTRTLVVVQIALSLILLTGAGLLIRSFIVLRNVDLGIRPQQILTVQVDRPLIPGAGREAWSSFYRRLIVDVHALPGVEAAGGTLVLPVTDQRFLVHVPHPGLKEPITAEWRFVSSEYFQTMGIPLRAGRYFTERDTRDTPRVAIINEALARRFPPGQNPIGQMERGARIIGIVGNVRQGRVWEEPSPQIYDPLTQVSLPWMTLVVRSRLETTSLIASIRRVTAALDPTQPLGRVTAMQDLVDSSFEQPRFRTRLLSVYAGVALLLVLVGIYGMLAYSLSLRVREIGIRMAVGARRIDIVALVLREAGVTVGIGMLLGAAGALALSRVMASFVYGIGTTDVIAFAAAPLLFVVAALPAILIPADRAARLDPLVALRHE